jgi:SAM-dependent methyltransferase
MTAVVEWIARELAHNHGAVGGRLFPARSVLDVGCGIYPQRFVHPKVHVCVDPYTPYMDALRAKLGDDPRYVFLNASWADALELFADASVDAVYALDVIEHLEKDDGLRFLEEAKRVARHQVVVFTPLGFYPQSYESGEPDRWGMGGAEYQTHRSGWLPDDFDDGWHVIACADFHDVDENGRELAEPHGAFWAIHGEAPRKSQVAPRTAKPADTNPRPGPQVRAVSARRPRILFVAMANSPHTAKWISQLEGTGCEAYLFPSEIPTVVPITPLLAERAPTVQIVEGWPVPGGGRNLALRLTRPFKPGWPIRAWQLARMIRKLRPDVVHSLEIQHAGYLTEGAQRLVGEQMPPWIVSNWGSDTYIFGRLADHRERIRDVLSACDYYTSECERDVPAARELGFAGRILPVIPAAGGVELNRVHRFRKGGPTSHRRVIALRGYQGWAGRALVGLRAIERAADALTDYRIGVYNWASSPDVPLAVSLTANRTGLDFEMLPYGPHDDIWRLLGRSRALVALSIGDGISTSMLEGITMGAFPIQSNTSCADEWIDHGRTGWLVHPEDPEEVEVALRRVVLDDELVDQAAEANAVVVRTRLESSIVERQALALYDDVLAEVRGHASAARRAE